MISLTASFTLAAKGLTQPSSLTLLLIIYAYGSMIMNLCLIKYLMCIIMFFFPLIYTMLNAYIRIYKHINFINLVEYAGL